MFCRKSLFNKTTITLDSDTIYYVNEWANVYAYAWKNDGGAGNQNDAWPGVLMTKTGYTYNGHDVYIYSIKGTSYTKIIFTNNKGSQIADLFIPSDANCYYNDSFDYVFVK